MKSEPAGDFSKLRWIFMYSIWGLAELIPIAAFVYSIYSVIILICGNWAGAAVFAGIVPGVVLFAAGLYIHMLARVPWHAGDYQAYLNCDEYQVRQVRLFYTILWNDEDSQALPHLYIRLNSLDPKGKKNGALVYHYDGFSQFRFSGKCRWLAYAWAILCEIFVFAVIFLSAWFMIWTGIEASVSFLSGSLLPLLGMGIFCRHLHRKEPRISDGVHAAGLTWVIMEDHETLHLRHFTVYTHLRYTIHELCRKSAEAEMKRELTNTQGRGLEGVVWFSK